jgi:hypothetical protein
MSFSITLERSGASVASILKAHERARGFSLMQGIIGSKRQVVNVVVLRV